MAEASLDVSEDPGVEKSHVEASAPSPLAISPAEGLQVASKPHCSWFPHSHSPEALAVVEADRILVTSAAVEGTGGHLFRSRSKW